MMRKRPAAEGPEARMWRAAAKACERDEPLVFLCNVCKHAAWRNEDQSWPSIAQERLQLFHPGFGHTSTIWWLDATGLSDDPTRALAAWLLYWMAMDDGA